MIAGQAGARNLVGHGKRWRDLVGPAAEVVRAWSWRFFCRRCRRTCSVSPYAVLPRHVYMLETILMAWFLAASRPVGEGHHDEAVYALVGVDRRLRPEGHRAGKPRWRSLARWTTSISTWWPTHTPLGPTWRERAAALLTGFIPGDGGCTGAIRRALAAHAAGGRAM